MVCKHAQLSFSTKTCNSADTSAVGLVAADPCGYELCCPVLRQQCRLWVRRCLPEPTDFSVWTTYQKKPIQSHSPVIEIGKKNAKGRTATVCVLLLVVLVLLLLLLLLLLLYIVHIVQVSARDFLHQHSLPGESVRPKWLQQCHRAALGHGGPMPGREMTTTCHNWSFVSEISPCLNHF